MNLADSDMIRFHLQILHGVTVKKLEKKKKMERLVIGATKTFGVSLENLPRKYIPEFGLIPCFMVDACSVLLERAGTVGLFRKPGSQVRIKTLRAKLNRGESSLSGALSYDVATLIKQFCRELPDPLFPTELHASLLKAQTLSSVEDRMSALQLLTCLLPARNFSCLDYLFNFLSAIAQRCSENLMTSNNLATVFAPCLLPPPDKTEMSEERLELRVRVLSTFIEKPNLFGVIPKAVLDSMVFLTNLRTPKNTPSKKVQRKRHSFKVRPSVKTVPWIQTRSKFTPALSELSSESTSEAKTGLRRSQGLGTFPNITLFRTCMPSTEQSSSTIMSYEEPMQSLLKRELRLGARFHRGHQTDVDTLCGLGKLQLTPWNRRSSL